MVWELILKHDQVGLPGIGTFVAEMVPASFSDKGYTINPPYRQLNFYPANLEDEVLAEFYAEKNGLELENAKKTINQFLSELKIVLLDRRTIALPGFGKLRATKEDNIFFVPDESLDISPDFYGLHPVSLKTHVESREEIALSVSNLASIMKNSAPEEPAPEAEPISFEIIPEAEEKAAEALETAETIEASEVAEALESAAERVMTVAVAEEVIKASAEAATAAEAAAVAGSEAKTTAPAAIESENAAESSVAETTETTQEAATTTPEAIAAEKAEVEEKIEEEGPVLEPEPERFRWWLPLVIILGIAFVALCIFIILAAVAPNFIDSILYTPEELEIINY